MNRDGTTFKGGWLTDTPCAGCGAMGVGIWLSVKDELCYDCRNGDENVDETQALVKVVEGKLEGPEQHPSLSEIESYASMALEFDVATDADRATAADVLQTLATRAKALEAEEKRATAPLNASLKVIRGWFAPARKAADEAIRAWKAAVQAGDQKRRLQSAQAAKAVSVAIQAGDSGAAALAHKLVNLPEPTQGIQTRKRWTWRITNFGMVPDTLKYIDDGKVGAELRRQLADHPNETPVVPGIIFEQVEEIAVR